MDSKVSIDLNSLPVGCQNCSFVAICQAEPKPPEHMPATGKFMVKISNYERGDHLFSVNDPFKNLYVIRSGSVKTYSLLHDGQEQVTGLHLAGKLLGLDAIGCEYFTESAIALETSSICEISYSRLENIREENPQLLQILWNAMSSRMREEHEYLRLLSRTTAASRLAGFLLNMSADFQRRGYSPTFFYINLSRHDIASLLGLAVETVSRMLTHFQEAGLITVQRRNIALTDMQGLKTLANVEEECARPRSRNHAIHGTHARVMLK